VPACCLVGWSTTIALARMRVSMGGLPWAASRVATTSCSLTP